MQQQWDDIKSRLSGISSQSQADTILADAASIAREAQALGLNFDIAAFEKTVDAKVKSYNLEIITDRALVAEQALKEQQALKKAEENEIRKSRLAINSKAYDELIKNGFHEELKKDNDFLEKAVKDWNSLSEEEQKKISRQGLTDDEKRKLKEEDRKKSEKISLAHQIEENAQKVKKYHQDRLDENN
ncbi:MAG: hypothetical protein RCO49_07255 [Rickettsia endosymbiont of Argas persicus]